MANKNIAKSVRHRLLNKAKNMGRPFGDLLLYYGIERFLYRLSLSHYKHNFFLKGALMFLVWCLPSPRPTRDIDFLAKTDNSIANLEEIFREICGMVCEADGIEWLSETIKITMTQKHKIYSGARINFRGKLDTAMIPMQIDIGFADIIHPKPEKVDYPSLLNMSKPQLLGYTLESVIAEKIHAVFTLGELNSRMKDYFDIWFLSRQFEFDGKTLSIAIVKTFIARKLQPELIETPSIFDKTFNDNDKFMQWDSFLRQNKLEIDLKYPTFDMVIDAIGSFILPVIMAIKARHGFSKKWNRLCWV